MSATFPYSATDAATYETLAAIANADLSSGPLLPTGWAALASIQSSNFPSLQGYLAQGAQPSNPTQVVVVLALGALWVPLLNWYNFSLHQLTGLNPNLVSRSTSPDSEEDASPPASPVGQYDLGYQTLYSFLRGAIWPVLPQAGNRDLIVVGHGLAAPLAQLAALDLRPNKPNTTSTVLSVTLYSFSTPTLGDANFQVFFQGQVPGCYAGLVQGANGTPLDFYPTVPAGTLWVQPSLVETIAAVSPTWDDPWWERSSELYAVALGTTPLPAVPRGCSTSLRRGAPPVDSAFDPDLAFVLAELSALAYERYQHPNLPLSGLPAPWTLVADVATSAGVTFASIFRTPTQVAVAFRGTVSLEELLDIQGNFFFASLPYLPPGIGQFSRGVSGLYTSLRTNLFAALVAIPNLPSLSLLLTGHSLGGALATLAAIDLATPQPSIPQPAAVYSFGAPPFANTSFQTWYDGSVLAPITFRVARDFDFMPNANFNFLLVQAPTAATLLSGSTPFDGVTFHPVSGYIQLLSP